MPPSVIPLESASSTINDEASSYLSCSTLGCVHESVIQLGYHVCYPCFVPYRHILFETIFQSSGILYVEAAGGRSLLP